MGLRGLWRFAVPRAARVKTSAAVAALRGARLERELDAIARGNSTIVAGPWLGEVGFELLYWAPFLAWFAERFQIAPERLLVVSRGGTASWYSPFASRYADVFSYTSTETFKAEHDARVTEVGEQKQTRPTHFERHLVGAIVGAASGGDWTLLHPSRMYELLNPYWWGHLSERWVHQHVRYRVLPRIRTDALALPASYVATKFYFNECFPATPHNRAFVRDALERLAGQGPVVSLSTGLRIDDHDAVRVDHVQQQGLMHLPEGIDPAMNLAVQTAVVAGARAFVGTYGGFSYLAPFHRVPSFACYSDASGFSPKHLAMARSAFDAIGSAGLLHVTDVVEGQTALAGAGVIQ